MESETNTNPGGQQTKPPTVLDGFLQPSFPFAKVFTCFFLNNCMVFTKTGSFGTNAAGTMRGSLGGFTPAAMVAGAVGTLVDMHNDGSRAEKAAGMSAYSPENMVAAHKRNFMLPYGDVRNVELKGPNFAGEFKVIVYADKIHKFRIDRQSKASAQYIESVFNQFLPGKIIKK